MICDECTELLELYAAGALEKTEADALRHHLDTGCEQCASRLDEALQEVSLIAATVPLVEPPASLRDRIAASVRATPQVVVIPTKKKATASSFTPWLIAAASVAALAVGIGFEETTRRSDLAALQSTLDETQNENARRTAAMLSILQAPGTKQVAFDITKADLPHGSLFIHKNLGVAMVVAHLPAAPQGWKYESWVVPKSGEPRPIESFATDNTGFAFTVVKGPVDVSQWAAMAVSMEPEDSRPVKPTKVVFASPLQG